MSAKKSLAEMRLTMDTDDDSSSIEEKRIFGCVKFTMALKTVVTLRLMMEILAIYLSCETVFFYVLVVSSIGTFTELCIIIDGLMDEKAKRIHITKICLVVKYTITWIVIAAVLICRFVGNFEILNSIQLTPEMMILCSALPFAVVAGCVQWYFTVEIVKYLSIRDDIYTIPSGKFKWRPEILHPREIRHQKF